MTSSSIPQKNCNTDPPPSTNYVSDPFRMMMTMTTTQPPPLNILDELSMSTHTVSQRDLSYPSLTSIEKQTNWIVAETNRTLDTMQRNSYFFVHYPPKSLPTFQEKELQLGQMIGNGQFGIVFEVTGFDLNNINNEKSSKKKTKATTTLNYSEESCCALNDGEGEVDDDDNDDNDDDDDFPFHCNQEDTKCYMSTHVLRRGSPRFAIKRVRMDLLDERKSSSAIDLAVEAKILASIDHSNIIKLRGTVSKPGYDSFMIVLDRLYSILDHQIKQWKSEVQTSKVFFGFRVFKTVDHYKAKTERLVCMYDIARALKHLHHLKILYRDLKPENIGCDVRGDYKIFDFGLAKELKRDLLKVAPDGYQCTGLTGSRRWMAPEICLCKLYGFSSDVYSYSLLFYHVLTLELPYERYDLKTHMRYVVLGGERPNGKKIKLSMKLRDTIIQGWREDPHQRPSMSEICNVIQDAVVDRKQDVKKNKRRSTVVNILRRSQILSERSALSMVAEDSEVGSGNEDKR